MNNQEIASAAVLNQSGFPDGPEPSNYSQGQFLPGPTPGQGDVSQQNSRSTYNSADNSYRQQFREHWDRPRPTVNTPNHDVMTDVVQAGTEVNWEYAAIERRDESDLTTRVIAFNLGNAIDKVSSADNQPLKPGDVVEMQIEGLGTIRNKLVATQKR